MSARISLDRQEFQAFLAQNQELLGRYEKLVDQLDGLRKLNKDLDEKLRQAEQKLDQIEHKMGVDVQQADETLRKARDAMARLIQETDRRLSE